MTLVRITGRDEKVNIDRGICLPANLTYDLGDGRQAMLREWHPHVSHDKVITATAVFVIKTEQTNG